MDIKEQAIYYKHNGKNCAQAVMLALKDKTTLSEEEIIKLTSGLGHGFGCLEATCGALIGANLVLGLNSTDTLSAMKGARDLLQEFNKRSGATICKDLKGVETGVMLCSCDDCIRNAIDIVLEKIGESK